VYLGIYWNNHHHLFHVCESVDGGILWANLHLLFWLSLIPLTTGWMGQNHWAPLPTAAYGVVLLCAAIAYIVLQTAIVRHQGPDSKLHAAIGADLKGKISMAAYAIAIAFAFVAQPVSLALYVAVALLWLIPDRRIARLLAE
jgi:TMEM175 potassium channel family protein